MRKTTKSFSFQYPLKHKVVRDLRIVTQEVGTLEVEGVGYFDPSASVLDIFERFAVDIDLVKWNGTDIRPVLEVTGGMEDITEAAVRFIAGEFEQTLNRAA
ncbi:MAG: hypothetical protein ACJ749_06355 [Flavisolibacter sp.]